MHEIGKKLFDILCFYFSLKKSKIDLNSLTVITDYQKN